MAIFAIGDIQGCCDEFELLLDRLRFNPAKDQLWLTGDLVNRGPRSLDTLRLVKSFGSAAITVLGNHDLFMLAAAKGHGKAHKGDTFEEVLDAPDADDLLGWLSQQKLAHHESGWLMVHAGVLPSWDVAQTLALAAEAER